MEQNLITLPVTCLHPSITLRKYYENSMKLLRHFHVPIPC